MKKAIFIDRDGTLLREPADEQIDALDKVAFVPGAISGLRALTGLGYELVMASNQDGLGTASFPEETFWPAQNFLLQTLEGEGVVFDDILIDPSMPEEHSPNRKPGTGMFGKYLDGSYDLAASWVIGDRETDRQLAANLGAQALLVGEHSWAEIAETIRSSARSAVVARKTKETDIYIRVDLDGKGPSGVDTGLKFFDHMLSQLITHGGIALEIRCKGDLEVDEHHTIEDVGIALGGLRPADGRDARHRAPRLRRPQRARLGCRIHPRIRRRRAHGDVQAFLQVPLRRDARQPLCPGPRREQPPHRRGCLQGVRPHAAAGGAAQCFLV